MRLPCRILLWLLCSTMACLAADKTNIALDPATFPPEMKADVAEIDAAFRKFPDDASVLYQVASLHAKAGHFPQALAALERMADVGAGLQPRPRDFPGLSQNPEFLRIVLSVQKKNPPVQHARLAYELSEGDLIPEGIAWSQTTRKFYLGSIKRKIVALSEDGTTQDFVKPAANGLGIVIGLRVDDQRGELWAVSESIGPKPPDLVAGIFCYKLSDGSLVHAYAIPGSEKELLNDLVVAKDGSLYVTATNSGSLYRIDGATGALPDPNGITITADDKYLYVAGWYGISRVTLKNKKVELLDKPANVADGCIDGLYLYGKFDLVGIQNCNDDPGRVLDFHLIAGLRIDKATVLESYNPMFESITTAAIAGDQLYFMANTQFRKLGKDGKPIGQFDPLKILRLDLKR